ncbi:hypothetical protein IF1G_03408 [Cordyceps javanica]|uniref:Uncharacterized protein n=1 Tax=Cordyceps javanica TaxID=43265 RepID=A0A545V7K0_9HYPO|nr:hypothetical protein IF1G_03408 [Cordyceps javanica]
MRRSEPMPGSQSLPSLSNYLTGMARLRDQSYRFPTYPSLSCVALFSGCFALLALPPTYQTTALPIQPLYPSPPVSGSFVEGSAFE